MKISEPAQAVRATLLVVDDDPEILAAIQRAFRDEPYEILSTSDPYEAVKWLKGRRVDVVVADEFMPAMRGSDLLQAAAGSHRVLLTGYPGTTASGRAAMGDVDLVLHKPWDDQGLRGAVRALLAP